MKQLHQFQGPGVHHAHSQHNAAEFLGLNIWLNANIIRAENKTIKYTEVTNFQIIISNCV